MPVARESGASACHAHLKRHHAAVADVLLQPLSEDAQQALVGAMTNAFVAVGVRCVGAFLKIQAAELLFVICTHHNGNYVADKATGRQHERAYL
jgi:hypothetical protein